MADTSANLLFRINADPKAAQRELKKFRKDFKGVLSGMKGDTRGLADFLESNLGNVNLLLTGMIAGVAGVAAGAGVALLKLANDAARYAGEIESVSDKTGMAVEEVSRLRYAAETAGVNYNTLNSALVEFTNSIVEARHGSEDKRRAFKDLGITQQELAEGTADMTGLLYRLADAFAAQDSVIRRTAAAQKLFGGTAGSELVEFLSRGSDQIREFTREAERMGLVMTQQDIVAAKQFRLELLRLNREMDAIKLQVGQQAIPAFTGLLVTIEALRNTTLSLRAVDLPRVFVEFYANLIQAAVDARKRINAALTETGTDPGAGLLPPKAKKQLKDVKTDFEGISTIVHGLAVQLAGFLEEEEQITFEAVQIAKQFSEALDELRKLRAEGKITGEVFQREMAAAGQFGALLTDLVRNQREKLAAERAKAEREAAEAEAKARAEAEKQRQEEFIRRLEELQREMETVITTRMTAAERIEYTYQQGLVRFSEVEEAKTLLLARTEGEREAIRVQFELNRQAAQRQYETDLNALYNSQGWQGVFGEYFAYRIRFNAELLREWAESSNQSLLMVRVAVESLKESARETFGSFSQAMGANIAQAIIYRESIGQAMRAATAAALESIAAQSFVQAIYATALGFLRLAMWDPAGAAAAFKAAALFGVVGVAAAAAGRAVAPSNTSTGGSTSDTAGTTSESSSTSSSSGSGGTSVQIHVYGSIYGQSGVEELTEIINDAVQNRDVTLLATSVKQDKRAIL